VLFSADGDNCAYSDTVLGRFQEERLARNEAFFREVNERIREAGDRFDGSAEAEYEFLCECPEPDCVDRIKLTLAAYEAVRADARRFVVAPGHDVPEIEHLVAEDELVAVVEKDGAAGEVAERLDPRH
jgi:hypothetical protein